MLKFVLGFYFDQEDKRCLLIHRTKKDWQEGLVNGIGGKISDDDESPITSMIREFEEETNLATNTDNWTHVLTLTSHSNDHKPWIMFVFRGIGTIPLDHQYESEEGLVYSTTTPPHNMERTAKWLYWMCHDPSLSGVRVEGVL